MSRRADGSATHGAEPLCIQPYTDDDALVEATRADGRTRVNVYAFDRTAVVLGRGSDPDVELDVEKVRTDGVRVERRRGGGCAVVLDPGNVIVTVALALPGLDRIRSTFDSLTTWLIGGLERAGLDGVRSDGVSDLVLGDRKIAGSCVHRALGRFTFSASLLVAPDLALMSRYLTHPPREPAYRRGREHAAFVTSILEVRGGGGGSRATEAEEFRELLARALDEPSLDSAD